MKVRCDACQGDGWTLELVHAYDAYCAGRNPNGDCRNCPVQEQVECDECRGQGYHEVEEPK